MKRPTLMMAACLLLGAPSAACAVPQDATAKKDEVTPERRRPTDGVQLRNAAFAPDQLAQRRAALFKALPAGAVVVVGSPRTRSDIRPYRPPPNFLYLSGQGDAGLTLLRTATEDVLFAPRRDARWERWNGPRMAVGTMAARASGFKEVVNRSTRNRRVKAALERDKGPLYLSGVTLKELDLPATTETRSLRALSKLRLVKDAGEVALLTRAIDITAASLLETMASIHPGQFEYEAQAVIEYGFARYGAQRPGFTSIVGSGPNSCVLHYSANRRRMQAGDLVVMDVGAEYYGYTADVTRTVPVSGKFTPRQKEIYEIVLRAQEAGIKAIRPGVTMQDVHRAATAVIAKAGYRRYFLHSTSHWLGLDVHDVGPTFSALKPGMVLTVEPGIYIAKEQLGVRIEDDVLVTATGGKVLSAGVPRTVAEIEALMSRKGVGARAVAPLPKRAAPAATPRTREFFLRPR